jgi:hypothetical protein
MTPETPMTLAMICYGLCVIGMYRGTLASGWNPKATARSRWRARLRVAWLSLIWPYTMMFAAQRPKKTTLDFY